VSGAQIRFYHLVISDDTAALLIIANSYSCVLYRDAPHIPFALVSKRSSHPSVSMDSTSVYSTLVGLAVYASARRKSGQGEEAIEDIAEQKKVGLLPIYTPEPPLAVDVE
jgi:hypothetical protein